MKSEGVTLPGCVGGEGEFTPSVSPSSSMLSLAAETTLFEFVVLTKPVLQVLCERRQAYLWGKSMGQSQLREVPGLGLLAFKHRHRVQKRSCPTLRPLPLQLGQGNGIRILGVGGFKCAFPIGILTNRRVVESSCNFSPAI